MPRVTRLVMLGGLALLALAAWPTGLKGETPMTYRKMTLLERVGPEVFDRAGLGALTPGQQMALAGWLEGYTKEIVAATEEACRRQGGQDGPPTWRTPK
ncbi:MAG: hypothetical protein HY910_07780 [Desulfarculus sp.]|nr:hypothetical protein [Desulfarculus sp.]